ncbi:MAG: methionine biosynthesis protein MetW [Vitreimonas sp.]
MALLELVQPGPLRFVLERRGDHDAIAALVHKGARVLDVGCGDGALLRQLARERNARARGLEIDPVRAQACVVRGLSVVQADADCELDHFPSAAFEYVVFSHSLFCLRRPLAALKNAARIGEHVIVAFDNAGQWRNRMRLTTQGRLTHWGDGRDVTVRDFAEAARELRLTIDRALPLSNGNAGAPFARVLWRANWFAEQAVFLLTP